MNNFMRVKITALSYQPSTFLDFLIDKLKVRSDSDLCRRLNVHNAQISRVRHKIEPISCNLAIAAMDATGLPLNELRNLAGANNTETRRARLVRDTDLMWRAKDAESGEVIHKSSDRSEVARIAAQKGYYFAY
jgi:hypothetical protein